MLLKDTKENDGKEPTMLERQEFIDLSRKY